MVHYLKNAAARLWVANLLGTGAGLLFLAQVKPDGGSYALPAAMAVLLAAIFAACGWVFNRLGLGRMRRLLRQAGAAERQGLNPEAEALFKAALSALDSFLVSPAVRRRYLPPAAGRTARFYVGRGLAEPAAFDFVCAYLARYPEDGEVAEAWVRCAREMEGPAEEIEDLAGRLGAAHPDDERIQLGLARLYLRLERTDFTALQGYRRLWESGGGEDPAVRMTLAALLRREGRRDDWALQVYRRCGQHPPLPGADDSFPREGPRGPRPAATAGLSPAPEAPLAAEGEEDRPFAVFGAGPAAGEDEEEDTPEAPRAARSRPVPIRARLSALLNFSDASLRVLRDLRRRMAQSLGRARLPAAVPRSALLLVPALALAGLGIWLALKPTGEPSPPPSSLQAEPAAPPVAPPAAVTDPFTLQVAAYLKPEYALKFVEELKKKGLDAYWTETASGDKRWYQVRISHFPDAASAREFGRRLKQEGVVDDFYVAQSGR
jgi:hypothetical protein